MNTPSENEKYSKQPIMSTKRVNANDEIFDTHDTDDNAKASLPGLTDSRNNVNVMINDQISSTIILPMVRELAETTLSISAVINAYTITVSDPAGFVIGQHLRIINSAADRFYFGTILGIAASVITLDTQIDFIYVAGSEVTVSDTNMNVDGSSTPVIFTLRTGSPSIPSSVDITRMIFTCIADSPVDLSKFGDLAALTRGIAFRSNNGIQDNIFNIKTNAELAGIDFDFDPYAATNPAQGIDGFISRLTFAGQNRIGVALRVPCDGNLEMIIQDDLRLLTFLGVILEGHVVED